MSDEIKEKIMQRVQIDPETGCWNWTGSIEKGNPILNIRPAPIRVRRYLFGIYYGEIFESNIHVGVTCGNKLCVCPEHFVLQMSGKVGDFAKKIELRKQQTHCKHGHSLEDAYIDKMGSRGCRVCRKASHDKLTIRRREAKNHDAT